MRRYTAGEFGNAAPTWLTLDDYLASGYDGLVHIRNVIAGGPTWYNVPAAQVADRYRRLARLYGAGSLYLSAMAPTADTVLQGEVARSVRHLDLFYSTAAEPMRIALAQSGRHAYGLRAKVILDTYMDAPSRGWLDWLLDTYPDHTVEFSVYSRPWGTVPGYRTVFWEVRRY